MHFDHVLSKNLVDSSDADAGDESASTVATSYPSRTLKVRAVEPMPVPFHPSYNKCDCRMSNHERQNHTRSLEKQH